MNWFSKIFKIKTSDKPIRTNKYTISYFEGLEAFKVGKKLWSDSVLDRSLHKDRRKQKAIAALEFFDKAIENGYDEADVFSLRGNCLRDLNYDDDAIDDFNKCIDKSPERASFYYDRAITKQFINDFDGSLDDFKEAIRLSKFDNVDTRYWDEYARKTGYESGTHKYELDLYWLLTDKERADKSITMQEIIKKEREKVKRRFQ